MLIDTHSHIYDEAFDTDRAETIARAQQAGVGLMLLPATDSQSHEALMRTCQEYPGICLPMIGLHPTSVNDNPAWRDELIIIEKYLAEPPLDRFYAIGEIGLDLHWSQNFLKEQTEVFERQIELSLTYSLPIVVHTREAWSQMLETLDKYAGRGLKGVMHSFSGTFEDYLSILACGNFSFGIGGPVTYKKSSLPEIVAQMDLTHILLETDCPYLPPVPYRGKRNESGYLPLICEKIAGIKGLAPEEVARITTDNARRVFAL